MAVRDHRDEQQAELSAARRRVAELEAELSRTRSRDSVVTALPGVRAFRAQVALEVQRSRRYRRPLTLLAIDIDGFRKVNLEGGMGRGDALLRDVAEMLAVETRVNDQICRLGGDEFSVLLPETPGEGALEVVRRILIGFESLDGPPGWSRSASIGVAGLATDQAPEALLAAAREALEEARSRGGATYAVWSLGREAPEAIAAHGELVAALESALGDRAPIPDETIGDVAELAEAVAEASGLDAEAVANVRTAGRLHDIGKCGVPEPLLAKRGALDETEWAIVRQHPLIGERLLAGLSGMTGIARVVRHTHERWDGRGYPDNLIGSEIPYPSRIIAACDAYVAMRSTRPYRPASTHSQAIAELGAQAGAQFDPDVTEILIGVLFGRAQTGRKPDSEAGRPALG